MFAGYPTLGGASVKPDRFNLRKQYAVPKFVYIYETFDDAYPDSGTSISQWTKIMSQELLLIKIYRD